MRLTASIEAERGRLVASVGEQVGRKGAAEPPAQEKQKLQSEAGSSACRRAGQRPTELAAKAGSLKDLIATLEKRGEEKRPAEAQARLQAEREEAAARGGNRRCLCPTPTGCSRRQPFASRCEGQVAKSPVAGRMKRRSAPGGR